MSEHEDAEPLRQIDRLCDQFEQEWKAGRRPRIEPLLEQVESAHRSRLLRELLQLERDYRQQANERVVLGDYQQRFPDYREVLLETLVPRATDLAAPKEPAEDEELSLTLAVVEGPCKGREFRFTGHEFFLAGRSAQAHLHIPGDGYLSRLHFLVEVNPPVCRLTDLRSRNHTLVNGAVVESVNLVDGDVIQVGRTSLRVSIGGLKAAATVPPAPAEGNEAMTLCLTAPSVASGPPPAVPLAATHVHPAPPATTPALTPGEKLPDVPGYRILDELGRGGMGIVYRAERLADGTRVALKTILPAANVNRKQVDRFLREASVLQKLDHPHIVRCLEVGESRGLLYFTMEHVEGMDAAQLLRKRGALDMAVAVRMVVQLLLALEYAHERGFVHRDIKPANLLVASLPGKKSIKLADFGLARVYQESRLSGLTIQGEMGGTVAFMPPEQITDFRKVKPAADQYSAAATLYNLLTDKYPHDFDKTTASALTVVLQETPVPLQVRHPAIPEQLAAVIHRALARKPEDRYPDARAFRQALLPFAH